MSANKILLIYLLGKHSKLTNCRSQTAKISCPQNRFFGNPQKYPVREKFLSYSIRSKDLLQLHLLFITPINVSLFYCFTHDNCWALSAFIYIFLEHNMINHIPWVFCLINEHNIKQLVSTQQYFVDNLTLNLPYSDKDFFKVWDMFAGSSVVNAS